MRGCFRADTRRCDQNGGGAVKLLPEEQRIDGRWELQGGRVVADAACQRIAELTSKHLNRVASDGSGWDTLFQDPEDGRYWEMIYTQSEMHGGGPPSLVLINTETARAKYGVGKE